MARKMVFTPPRPKTVIRKSVVTSYCVRRHCQAACTVGEVAIGHRPLETPALMMTDMVGVTREVIGEYFVHIGGFP
jgi:hypothetical protein